MTMQPVTSSNIHSIGYDPTTKVLRVKFHQSGTYEFQNVAPHQHQALMGAKSHGVHFQKNIRHSHDFRKLDE